MSFQFFSPSVFIKWKRSSQWFITLLLQYLLYRRLKLTKKFGWQRNKHHAKINWHGMLYILLQGGCNTFSVVLHMYYSGQKHAFTVTLNRKLRLVKRYMYRMCIIRGSVMAIIVLIRLNWKLLLQNLFLVRSMLGLAYRGTLKLKGGEKRSILCSLKVR